MDEPHPLDLPPPHPAPLDLHTRAARGVRAPAPEELPDGLRSTPYTQPLFQTSAYSFPTIDASDVPLGGEHGYAYGRYGHPNGRSLELSVAALEGTEDALATASGMAALTCAILAHARAGDRVLFQADAYGGTVGLLREEFAQLGITVEPVDAYDLDAVRSAVSAQADRKAASALVVETLSNPLVRPADLAGLAAACRASDTALLVDSTFASPILVRPAESGATAVIHSATKFLGGHHDVTAGIVAGDAAMVARARKIAVRLGSTVAPLDAWLAVRGLRTLALRVERQQDNARHLAERLRADGRVEPVHYPGWGALLSFDTGSRKQADRLVQACRLLTLTPTLGGVTTTLSHAATSSHRGLTPDARRALGIGDGLLRISAGIESAADLWRDLEAALGAGDA